MAPLPDEHTIRVTLDFDAAEKKLGKLAIIMTTIEARIERAGDHIQELNRQLARVETARVGKKK